MRRLNSDNGRLQSCSAISFDVDCAEPQDTTDNLSKKVNFFQVKENSSLVKNALIVDVNTNSFLIRDKSTMFNRQNSKKKYSKASKYIYYKESTRHRSFFTTLLIVVEIIFLTLLLYQFGFGYFCADFKRIEKVVRHHSNSLQVNQISLNIFTK